MCFDAYLWFWCPLMHFVFFFFLVCLQAPWAHLRWRTSGWSFAWNKQGTVHQPPFMSCWKSVNDLLRDKENEKSLTSFISYFQTACRTTAQLKMEWNHCRLRQETKRDNGARLRKQIIDVFLAQLGSTVCNDCACSQRIMDQGPGQLYLQITQQVHNLREYNLAAFLICFANSFKFLGQWEKQQ